MRLARRAARVAPLVVAASALAGWIAQMMLESAASSGDAVSWMFSGVFLLYAVVGAVVAYRRPGNAVGWLLLGMGFLECVLGGGLGGYGVWAQASGMPHSRSALALAGAADSIGPGSGALTLLLFPTGKLLPGRGWRLASALISLWMVAAFIAALGSELAVGEGWSLPAGPLFALSPLVLLVGAVGVVARARGPNREVRQQLKWVAFSAVLLVLGLLLVVVGWTTGLAQTWGGLPFYGLFLLSLMFMPVAIGIGILRHGLFDIDRLISRTVSYTVLTAILVAAYVGVVLGLTVAMRAVGGSSDLAVAMSTLAVAALFQRVRHGVQSVVDRRFNRRRYDAARTVEEFGATLRDEVNLPALATDLRHVVRTTIAPTHSSVWLRGAQP